ncbi:hypothetical protein RHMOL_Rhmol04G0065000 [Rhododendron molle]|uniref:Uncharacterized protein n=1 Tax=Rhododendron molle TaxID=49168 RepID=A0ACC0NXR8_RHOML|nr:hypothetical protein RHMOL_Rhmol04G0065000 [Rhododendron molle]
MPKRGVNKKSRSGPPPPRNRRANIATAAATTISELPDDVIFDILVKMPDIKSVIRCKRVCKKWRNLILQPCFTKSQSSRGSLPPSLIFYSPPDVFTNPARFGILELDDDLDCLGRQNATITFRSGIYIPHELYKRRLIGACNGLVCLHVDEDIVVCNPILQGRRPLVLPKPAHSSRSRFRDDTWRSIGGGGHNREPFSCRLMPPGTDFVFVNGALYWLGEDMASRLSLCYFDMDNEELGRLG